jgi:SAM-dependent methyltransferase
MTEPTEYIGHSFPGEGQRLLQQCQSLEKEACWLLDRVGIRPGWHVVDIGCGPLGILDLLSARVGPAGQVVGLEWEPRFISMAESVLAERHLTNVRLVEADATATGLPRATFDFVHERLVLHLQPHPERILAEMVALVRPGGIVAVQGIDHAAWFCEPPHPAWTTLLGVFHTICRAHGVDLFMGRRLPALLRAAGLVDVGVEVHIRVDPPGAYRRKQLLALLALVQDTIVAQGFLAEQELRELQESLEHHLDDPQTVVPRELLFQAWGYKPER